MSLLESTCICEQVFSYIKHTENKVKTKNVECLENTLRIAIACIKPDIDELVSKKKLSVFVK